METANERRKRKLQGLVAEHGLMEVAQKASLSPVALEQILKGVLLPAKSDGTRSPKSLGDRAARAIEAAFGRGEGWFDAPDSEMTLGDDALAVALSYAKMTPTEKQRFRLLMLAARDGVEPIIAPVPDKKRHPRGTSILGGLEDIPHPASKKKQG